ncbi:MAG: hypothetical protein ABEJ66_02785 [Candidatus Nanohaloarchaea archaeon]
MDEQGVEELLEEDRGQLTLLGLAALYSRVGDRDFDELKEDAKQYAADKYFEVQEYFS